MRPVVGVTIAVDGYQGLVRQLDCLTKTAATAVMIDVDDHNAIVVKVPRMAVVATD